jgi:hypothetical protein
MRAFRPSRLTPIPSPMSDLEPTRSSLQVLHGKPVA